MKSFKGKAIYNPSGKAGEYSYWACNFYNGCTNGCTYCYLKKGIGAKVMGGSYPILKKCFKHEAHALEVFKKELHINLPELQKHGLFFSFTTDPMLPETIALTSTAAGIAVDNGVPVKILTKCTKWVNSFIECCDSSNSALKQSEWRKMYAFGFTLTGHSELEPHASPTSSRITAMIELHNAGFRTFASIEPIIDFETFARLIELTVDYCDLFKIGLLSGGEYSRKDVLDFVARVYTQVGVKSKLYFKDSLLKLANIDRKHELPDNCVTRDYNMFHQ